MDDMYLNKTDYKDQIISYISQETGVSSDIVLNVFNFLEKNQNVLSEGEFFTKEQSNLPPGKIFLSLTLADAKYSINLRAVTVFIISIIIDSKIQLPVSSTILAIKGLKQLITTIDIFSGARCILLEIMRSKTKTGDINIFENHFGQCINNYLECNHRDSDFNCTCNQEKVKHILNKLENDGVLKKINDVYHYSPLGFL